MSRPFVSLCGVFGMLAGVFAAGCGGNTPNSNILVTINSPASGTTLDQGQTVSVIASVSNPNGGMGQGVTWSLYGAACTGAGCGSLTNETTGSVTYVAPAPLPSSMTVTIAATSLADPTKSAAVSISLLAISVAIEPKVTELAAGTGQYFFAQFSAFAQNDPNGGSVTWTLTANGTPCSPACGTVTVFNSDNVPYTPPATVPASPGNMPTLTATSVTDPTKSDTDVFTIFDGATACGTGGNESILKGNYAIMVQGWSGSGTGTPIIYAASFVADGTGKITAGQDQYNPYTNYAYGAPL
jgi:hypothetical protein